MVREPEHLAVSMSPSKRADDLFEDWVNGHGANVRLDIPPGILRFKTRRMTIGRHLICRRSVNVALGDHRILR